jgi:C4-dicarboxylate-specific signal transduction histidine kinase
MRIHLQQVILNLLNNALDAAELRSSDDCWVRVRVSRFPSIAEISIEDSGPGFETCDIKRIFEPYVTTKPNGLGMGLPISRSLVESAGGTISVACAPAAGAIFRVSLPVSAARPT